MSLSDEKFYELLNQIRGVTILELEYINPGDIARALANNFAAHGHEEVERKICDEMGTLPEKERLVISLYYWEELGMKDIERVLGRTESVICRLHTRAVLGLRSRLNTFFGGISK